jgi:putative MFS transporter
MCGGSITGSVVVRDTREEIAARLDRLPIVAMHRKLTLVLALAFFFEFADINTLSFASPAIMDDWGTTISSLSVIVSGTFMGMFLGATLGGMLADRIGRRKSLILTTVWFSFASLMNALVWSPASLFFTRLLTGAGLSAMTVVGIAYVCEIFPARQRGAYQGWILALGILGIPTTALVARLVVPIAPWGWRMVFVWGAFGLLIPIVARGIEESPRWLMNRNRLIEAYSTLERMEDAARAKVGNLHPLIEREQGPNRRNSPELVGASSYLFRTFMLTTLWIFQTLGFYGFLAWAPALLALNGFTSLQSLTWSSVMQLGAVPGAFLGALVSDRWERKLWLFVMALLIAACTLIYGFSKGPPIIISLGFLISLLIQAFAPLLYAYTAECYPTKLRSSGTGSVYGTGRLANTLGPLLIAWLFNHSGYASVYVAISGCWIFVALTVGAGGPRTRGLSLT